MKCQDCGKKEATKKVIVFEDNEKKQLALCPDCAEKRGFFSPLTSKSFPLAELLTGMAQHGALMEQVPVDDKACPACGLTFKEFTRQGRFGCGECYRTFRGRIEHIMRKVHGASLHRGKNPDHVTATEVDADSPSSVKEEERLASELQKAIKAEDYERAAELRDKLRMIRESFSANA